MKKFVGKKRMEKMIRLKFIFYRLNGKYDFSGFRDDNRK